MKSTLRSTLQDQVVCIPLDSLPQGVSELEVGNAEAWIRRSGVDSVGRGTTRPASLGSLRTSASLLALLGARRFFRGMQRRSRSPMLSVVGVDRGAITDMASWCSFHSGPRLSAEMIHRPADISLASDFPFTHEETCIFNWSLSSLSFLRILA